MSLKDALVKLHPCLSVANELSAGCATDVLVPVGARASATVMLTWPSCLWLYNDLSVPEIVIVMWYDSNICVWIFLVWNSISVQGVIWPSLNPCTIKKCNIVCLLIHLLTYLSLIIISTSVTYLSLVIIIPPPPPKKLVGGYTGITLSVCLSVRPSVGDMVSVAYYIMAGHAIVVAKDINLLFYHGNAVNLTLW